jgi:hypothetical protein
MLAAVLGEARADTGPEHRVDHGPVKRPVQVNGSGPQGTLAVATLAV